MRGSRIQSLPGAEPVRLRGRHIQCGVARRLGVLLALGIGVMVVRGAEEVTPEAHAWGVVTRMFQAAAFDVAERELIAFVQQHTNSASLPEGYLLLGQAKFQQRKYEESVGMLRERLAGAGSLADRYRFWIAEGLFQLGRYEEAGQEYEGVVEGFPESPRRLDAFVGRAYALYRGGKSREAFEVLSRADGPLLAVVAERGGEEVVVRGMLLLGEAALASGQAAAAEPLLAKLPGVAKQELEWQRQYLLARLQAAAQRLDAASATVVALLGQLASSTNGLAVQYRADVHALDAEILEKRGDLGAALKAREQNLGVGVPGARRQDAAAQVARLVMLSMKADAASNVLESVLARFPGDVLMDPVRVAQAEVLLQGYYGVPEDKRSAALGLALRAGQLVSGVLTNPPGLWTGRAQLAAGFSAWEDMRVGGNAGRLAEALGAFQAASGRLARSGEQALARFKEGDCQLALTNHAGAMAAYWQVATNYGDVPSVPRGLAEHALYQVVRAGTESGQLEQAERAMGLLVGGGERSYAEEGVMIYAQALGRMGKVEEERKLYTDFLARFGGSTNAAQVMLMVARTYQQESKWAEAAAEYERWLAKYPEHPLRARAEYERNSCVHRSGDAERAFGLFTAYLQQYPGDPMASLARYWVADYFHSRGEYLKAEGEYQRVFLDTNAPVQLAYQARLMAGRSAYGRTSYREAKNYLVGLLNTNCPVELQPEVYYELGRAIWMGAETTNVLAGLSEAINAFNRIPAINPEHALVPRAWVEIGKCQFQLGTADPKQYEAAMVAYTNVVNSAMADVSLRSEAQVGMAKVLEKRAAAASTLDRGALLADALGRYLSVTEGGMLKPGESADPVWVERAGLAGALLAEEMQRWEVAEKLYMRLMALAPPLKAHFQFRLEQLKAKRAAAEAGAGG